MHLGRLGWIVMGGIVWIIVGMFLLLVGLYLLVSQTQQNPALLLALGLVLGFIKGYFILSNAAERFIKKLLLIPEPISFLQVYPPIYLCLIASMILLGIGLKWAGTPCYIRGVVDVAVGFALINASTTYFRSAYALKNKTR